MKCTEVSLQDQAISHGRSSYFFGLLKILFKFCYPYIQLGTVQNYYHDDDR